MTILETVQTYPHPMCRCGGCAAKRRRPCVAWPHGDPAAVYRIYGVAGSLIYVGCSEWVHERAASQCRVMWYYGEEPIARTVIEHYRTLSEARTVEARAIRDDAPVVNVKQERPPLHDGWVVVPFSVEVWRSTTGRNIGELVHAVGPDPDAVRMEVAS